MADVSEIKVLCVDDNVLVAEALRQVIDLDPGMTCVGCVDSADNLMEEVETKAPDIVLLDLTMPGRDPLEALKEVVQIHPNVRTIVCSGSDDEATVDRAVEAGAWGFVAKNGNIMGLLGAIRKVAEGESVLPRA